MSDGSGLDELKRGLIYAEREYNQELEVLVALINKCVTWSGAQPSYRRRTIATTTQQVMDCSHCLLGELELYLTDQLPLEGIYRTLATHLERFYVYCTYCSQLEELRTMLHSAVDQNGDATDPDSSAKFGLERSLLPIHRLQEMRAQLKATLPVLTASDRRVEIYHCRSTIDQITQILDQCFKVLKDVNGASYINNLKKTLKDCQKNTLEANTTSRHDSLEKEPRGKNEAIPPNTKNCIDPPNNPDKPQHDRDKTEGNDKIIQSDDKVKTVSSGATLTSRQSEGQQSRATSSKKRDEKTLQRLSTEISKPNRTKTKMKANANENGVVNPVPAYNNYANISVFPLQLHKPYEQSIFIARKKPCRDEPSSGDCPGGGNISGSTRTPTTGRPVSRLGGDFNARTRATDPPPSLRADKRHGDENVETPSGAAGEGSSEKHPTAEAEGICAETEVGDGRREGITEMGGAGTRRKPGPTVPPKRNSHLPLVGISPVRVETPKATPSSSGVDEGEGLFEKPIDLEKTKPTPPSKPRRNSTMPNFSSNYSGTESTDKSETCSEKFETTSDVELRTSFRDRSATTNHQHLRDECAQARHTRYGVIVGRHQDWRDTWDVGRLEASRSDGNAPDHKCTTTKTTESGSGTGEAPRLASPTTQKTREESRSVQPESVVPKHDHSTDERSPTNTADSLDDVNVKTGERDWLDTSTLQPVVGTTLRSPLEETSPVITADFSNEFNFTKDTSPVYANGSFEVVEQLQVTTEPNQSPLSPRTKSRQDSKYFTRIIQAMTPKGKNRPTSRSPSKGSTQGDNVSTDGVASGGEPSKPTPTPKALGEPSVTSLGCQQQTGSKEVKPTTTGVLDEARRERSRAETRSPPDVRPRLPVETREANKSAKTHSQIDVDIRLCLKRLDEAVSLSSKTISEMSPGLSKSEREISEEGHTSSDTYVDKSKKLQLKLASTEDISNEGNVLEQDYETRFLSILENTTTRKSEISSAKQCTEYFNSIMCNGTPQITPSCKSPIDVEKTSIGSIVRTSTMHDANETTQETPEDKTTRINHTSRVLNDGDMEKSRGEGIRRNEITTIVQKANYADVKAINVDNEHQTTGFNHYENCRQETPSPKEPFLSNFVKSLSTFDDSGEDTSRHSGSTERTFSTTTSSSSRSSEYEVATSENIYEDVAPPEEYRTGGTRPDTSSGERTASPSSSSSSSSSSSCFSRKRSVIRDVRTKRLVRNSWKTAPLYQNYVAPRCRDDACRHTYPHTERAEDGRCDAAQRPTTIAGVKVPCEPGQRLDDHETRERRPESETEEREQPLQQQQQQQQQKDDDDDEHTYVDMSCGKAPIGIENDAADRLSYEVMLNQYDDNGRGSRPDEEHIYECVEDILAVCSEEDKATRTKLEDKATRTKLEDIGEESDSFVVKNKQPARCGWCGLQEVVESGVLGTLSNREKALYESKYELITSKVSYLKSLTILQTVFVQCDLMRSTLTSETRSLLFGFVAPMKRCSEHFLADLLSGWPRDIFLDNMIAVVECYVNSALDVYVKFCSEQVKIYEILKALKRTNKEFKKVLTASKSDEVLEGHSLESFLILPVQRITRFPLLVGSILCHLGPEHEEFPRWKTVHQRLLQVTVECNEAVRMAEQESRIHETKPAKSPRGKGNEKRSLWFARRK